MKFNILSRKEIDILLICIFSFILIYFSFQTKFLGEDEENYLGVAKEILKTGSYPVKDFFGDPINFPPLIPIILSMFSYSLGASKVMIALFGVLTLVMTYAFCERFVKKGFGIIASTLLFSISLFVQFSMLIYLEIPVGFFSIASLYFFLRAEKLKHYILPGILIGLGLLTKTSALLIPITLLLYSIYKGKLKEGLITILVGFLILAPWVVRNYVALGDPMYPGFHQVYDYFFGNPYPEKAPLELTQAAQPLIMPLDIVNSIGILATFFSIFGFSYAYYRKNEIGMLCLVFIVVFLVAFYSNLIGIKDVRYFSIIFPQICIMGTIGISYLNEDVRKYKIPTILVAIIILISLYYGISTALGTSTSTRFGDDYVKALKWIKTNSTDNAMIMTVFTGSCEFYSDRHCLWPVRDLKELMTTQSLSNLTSILKKNNVNYILIQQGITSQSYISSGTNTIGVFSLQFVGMMVVSKDFEQVYASNDSMIYTQGLILPSVIVYKVL